MALTLAEANLIIQTAIGKAQELNIRISVSVCRDAGRPVAFARMDGAIWASAYAAQGKAVASAFFGRPSGAINVDNPTVRGVVAGEGGRMIPGQGAVAIVRGGLVEGACGASGGTGQQDEECAQAGVDAL